ncbi:hypothetical protein [Halorubrum gandharaense]
MSDRRTARTVAGDDGVAVHHCTEWVCHLVDLCVVGIPLPPLDRAPPSEADREIAVEMEELYGWTDGKRRLSDGGWNRLEADLLDSDEPVSYQADDRLDDVAGERVIPLACEGSAAANWYVLFDLLPTYLTAVAADCRTLAERHRIDGSSSIATEWEDVGDLLTDLGSVIEYQTSVAKWIHVPDRDAVETARRTQSLADGLQNETRNLR